MSLGPAPTGAPVLSAMPNKPRRSERLVASTSSDASSIPSAAAFIAMHVARQDASPARNSQPGVALSPLPPSSVGMSVNICVPLAWHATTRRPACQCAVAGASSWIPVAGRRCKTDSTRRTAAAMLLMVMAAFVLTLTDLIVGGSARIFQWFTAPAPAGGMDEQQSRTLGQPQDRPVARPGRSAKYGRLADRTQLHRCARVSLHVLKPWTTQRAKKRWMQSCNGGFNAMDGTWRQWTTSHCGRHSWRKPRTRWWHWRRLQWANGCSISPVVPGSSLFRRLVR